MENNIFNLFNNTLQTLYKRVHGDFITAIIPACGKERTIQKVIEIIKKSQVDEIIIVDDGSLRGTSGKIKGCEGDVKLIRCKKKTSKETAMKIGLKNARGNILIFLDANPETITPRKVNMLINPVLNNKAEFVKMNSINVAGRKDSFEKVVFEKAKRKIAILEEKIRIKEIHTKESEESISAVVCTRNRLPHLTKCLTSLLNQSHSPKEIIIIDDNSKNKFDIYKFFKNKLSKIKRPLYNLLLNEIDIILIRNRENFGLVASRNTGVMVANSDIVAFLDDDGFAHGDWLKNLVKDYKDRKILGVGGPVVEIGRDIKTPTRRIKKLAYFRKGKIITHYRIKSPREANFLPKQFVPILQGGNMSFRRKVLLQINGGDINFIGNFYREETDLSFKVANKGRLLFEPSAITFHDTAKEGGSRDAIDLNRFLYYMFRNTIYFFFKHFNFKKAISFSMNSIDRQLKLIRENKTGLTRDYLKITNKKEAARSVVCGSLSGIYTYLKFKKNKMNLSEPISTDYFKLMFLPDSIKIFESETGDD